MTQYDSNYFEQRDILIPHLAQIIKDVIMQKRLFKVLDVGCGTGLLVKYLNDNDFEAKGCDLSPEAIAKARRINSPTTIQRGSATKLPYKNNCFDLVTSVSVIEHLTKNEAQIFIKETRRILKPRGYIFLVTPNFSTPLKTIQGQKWFGYSDPTHLNFFTPKGLAKLLEKHQFNRFQLTFPIKYHSSLDWEFPRPFAKLPRSIKRVFIYLLFTSPFFIIRNSFWILAQKK